jgi:replication factor A2
LLSFRGSFNLYLNQPGAPLSGQITTGGAQPLSAYSAQSHQAEVKDQYSHLQPVPRNIVQFMLSQPHSREGVHVGAIVKAVGADAELIVTYDGIFWLRNALERLMDDGVIFSTIDEAHFQVSQ